VVVVESVDARCAVIIIAILNVSIWRQSGVDQQTSSYCRINAAAIVVGGGHGEAITSNASVLVAVSSFIVSFISFAVIVLLRAVVVNFVDGREPDATVRPYTRVLGLLLV
jgi:hypothetical protein